MSDFKNAEEDLKFIKKVIEQSRQVSISNGYGMIAGGIYSVIGTIVSYILAYLHFENIIAPFWIIYSILFFSITFYYMMKRRKKGKVYSIYAKIINSIWISIYCAIIIMFFSAIIFHTMSVSVALANLSIFLAIAYFITSISTDSKLYKFISFGWFIVAFVLYIWEKYISSFYSPLFFMLFVILLLIVPGIIENRKWIKSLDDKK